MIRVDEGKALGSKKIEADQFIKDWAANLPTKIKDTYNYLKVKDQAKAEKYLSDAREAAYASKLRDTIKSNKYELFFRHGPIKFFIDKNDPILNTPGRIKLLRDLKSSVNIFLDSIKGIVPLKAPRFILRDLSKDKAAFGASAANRNELAPAYYMDRIIYLDFGSVEEPNYMTHEYAHYIADLIPKQSEPILKKEYEDMLDGFFSDKRKRTSMGGQHNINHRIRIADKLGLPSDYSVTNFDEWFAEIITYWKNIPNNVNTYKFKNAVKKVITRL